MAIETFNRYENKYLVNAGILPEFERRLAERMEADAYNRERGTYSIANIYYDTVDNQLIRYSLRKPYYKEKLRLRAYGIPHLDDSVYSVYWMHELVYPYLCPNRQWRFVVRLRRHRRS